MSSARQWVRALSLACVTVLAAACSRGFRPQDFANPEALYRGALQEYERREWTNAIAGFERLTLDLSSRDSLLIPTYFYLAQAHEQRQEFLLAAQAYSRLSDGFPLDTLTPKAVLGEGRSYQSLWRKPELDAEYGLRALGTFRVLLTAFPDGPEAAEATQRIATVEDWLARKDYETGVHYLKTRKAFDSSIIYFRDVIETYPNTPTARKAWLGLGKAYNSLDYDDEFRETCDAMRSRYAGDEEVRELCGAPVVAADTATAAPAGALPPR